MPSLWTFTINPIKELLKEEVAGLTADPFAGKNSPAHDKNDINTEIDCGSNLDALTWLKGLDNSKYDTVLYDPPYSITQAKNYGKKEFGSMRYWAECKNEVSRILKAGGKAICFGWTSQGLGKGRGFEMKRILLVPHGGSKNDTIVTVEVKN